jgi:predicted nucleic acid-binding protein
VRYWDTSALLPLLVEERRSDEVRRLHHQDPAVVTWGWTRVEVTGAIERLARGGKLSRSRRRESIDRFMELATSWDEVVDLVAVRTRATALLARHPLRAADAAQLGAALLVADGDPSTLSFVCVDERLAEAAEREGLRVLLADE